MQGTNGPPYFEVYTQGSNTYVLSDNPLPLNLWLNIACVSSGPTGLLYIDGVLVKSNNVSKPTKSFRTNNFIGKSSGSDAIADFDEIKIFNRALIKNYYLRQNKTISENLLKLIFIQIIHIHEFIIFHVLNSSLN